MDVTDLLILTSVPVVVTIVLLGVVVLAWCRFAEAEGAEEPSTKETEAAISPSDFDAAESARLRIVAISREGEVLRVDGLVDACGPGLPVPVGSPVTLEIEPPNSFWLDLSIERLLETWEADSRVIDLAVRVHPSGLVASLRSRTSVVNLPLVGGIPHGS